MDSPRARLAGQRSRTAQSAGRARRTGNRLCPQTCEGRERGVMVGGRNARQRLLHRSVASVRSKGVVAEPALAEIAVRSTSAVS